MDCFKIKNILDKFIERDLPDQVITEVRKHLSSCDECSAELKYLQKIKKELKSLDSVKAPSDFLMQLNRRIERQQSKGILSKIFFPLKIKLPIEAAGVLVTVILAVLFFLPEDKSKPGVPRLQKAEYLKEESEREIRIARIEKPKIAARRSVESYTAGYEKKFKKGIIGGSDDKKDTDAGTFEIAMLLDISPGIRKDAVREEKEYNIADSSAKIAGSPAKIAGSPVMSEPESVSKAVKKLSGEEIADEAGIQEEAVRSKAWTAGDSEKGISGQVQLTEKQIRGSTEQEAIDKIRNVAAALSGKFIRSGLTDKDKNIYFIIVEIPFEKREEFIRKISGFGKIRQPAVKTENLGGIKNIRYKINLAIINN